MPDEIRQELGFDVTQTLSALAQLEAAFEKFGNALRGAGNQIESLNQAGAKLDEGLKNSANMAREVARIYEQTRTPQEQYAAQLNKLNAMLNAGALDQETHGRAVAQAAKALEEANKTTHNFTISWQTLARVIETQLIVRTLSMIRDGLKEAYEGALQFSKSIAEIRAVDPSRSFESIAAEIHKLSDAFNQPIAKVAEAEYQAISNQFVSTADRLNVLMASQKLAKVSTQDLGDAVQLVAGALNAFGESSDMAGLRAAQFDQTIALGHFRMSELGTAMGRIQTIGHELGVSLEELAASLISTSTGGLKASEAATQIRGVLTALLKPSEGMKDAFRQLGVESGEAAIATYGLQGTLQQLNRLTNDSASAMGKLFPNIRGLAGALRLAGEGAEKYEQALAKLQQVDIDTLNKKFEQFVSTDAERLTKEFNKIGNFFKADFGMELIASLRKIVDLVGGADGLLPTIRAITSEFNSFVAAAAGLGVVAAGFGAMKLQAMIAADAVGGVRAGLLLLIGLPVAESLGKMLGNKLFDMATSGQKALEQLMNAEITMNKEKADAAIREENRQWNEIFKITRQHVAEQSKEYVQDAENLKSAMKIEEKVVKESLDHIMQSRQKMTQELTKIAEQAEKKVTEIPQQIADIQTSMMDRVFQQMISRFNPEFQIRELASKASQVADEAVREIGTAKDAEQMKVAEADMKRAEAFGKQAAELLKQEGGYQNLVRANEILNDLDNKRITAMLMQMATQKQIAQEAEARAAKAEEHNAELDRLRQAIEEKLKATTKDAEGAIQFKSADTLLKDLQSADALINSPNGFVEKLKQFGKEDFSKAFMGDTRAFSSMQRDIERQLAGINLQRVQIAPESFAAMYLQLQASLDKMRLNVPVLAHMEQVTGVGLEGGPSKTIDAYQKQMADATARGIRQGEAEANLNLGQNVFQQADQAIHNILDTKTSAGYTSIKSLVSVMEELSKKTVFTEDDVARLNKALAGLDISQLPGGAVMHAGLSKDIELMKQSLAVMIEAQQKKEELKKAEIEAAKQRQDAEAQVGKVIDGTTKSAQATVTAVDSQLIITQEIIPVVNSLGEAWAGVARNAAAAARAAAGAGSGGAGDFSGDSGGGGDFSFGGLIQRLALGGVAAHFDRGGFARRGTDTIPAMLSHGEFVMNARATQRFYSQLVAMNAGRQPVHRASGGSVTNAGIVGDVTVNVGPGNENTGREVLRVLNREIRRGTGRLYR